MGIDPSLTSTGFAYRHGGDLITGRIDTKEVVGPWRLHYVRNRIAAIIDKLEPDIVMYEDYAMGKGGVGAAAGRTFSIGELGGVLKEHIWARGIDIHLVSPTSLKKFVTGKGNPGFTPKGKKKLTTTQKKALIGAALRADFGVNVHQNDEADAAGLLLFGEANAGLIDIPQTPLKLSRAEAMKQFTVVRGKLQLISKS